FTKQWYLSSPHQNHINIESAWDLTTGSSKIIVAIVDSGVDYKNPELKENLWTNKMEAAGLPGVDDDENGYIDDIYGYDFVNDDGDPMDDHSHGTHLASIIGAKGNNGIGMAGIAWNVRLMPVKVLDASNSQNNLEIVERGIRYAVDNGAQIINASFAFTFDDDEMDRKLQSAIQYAEDRNVLVIAGSGNDGEDIDSFKMIPAAFENSNILTVTASDESGWRIDFANIGVKSVDLAAPGRKIWGLLPKLGSRFWGGTSQATAITTGVAALVLSKYPQLKPSEVRSRIMNSVKKSSKFKGDSITEGLLDAYQALL
nr:S8 family peptidase [Pseudobdellovibrionaceae bacterium]